MSATEPTLQQRLEAVRTAAERNAERSPEAARAQLEARARQLARPAMSEDLASDDTIDVLHIQVGDEQLAMPMLSVVALARPSSITPLPRAKAPVFGVTAWRGRPLTVLWLGAGRPTITETTRLLVLGSGARAALAVVVDAVHDASRISRAALSPALAGPRRAYAIGITTDGLLVVDGDALLDPDALAS
jgi:chemotaxis signal transduction protein